MRVKERITSIRLTEKLKKNSKLRKDLRITTKTKRKEEK